MRFVVGQAFEYTVNGRQAVICEIRDEGRAGQLRFLDNAQQQWVLWAQLHHTGEWLPIGMKDAVTEQKNSFETVHDKIGS